MEYRLDSLVENTTLSSHMLFCVVDLSPAPAFDWPRGLLRPLDLDCSHELLANAEALSLWLSHACSSTPACVQLPAGQASLPAHLSCMVEQEHLTPCAVLGNSQHLPSVDESHSPSHVATTAKGLSDQTKAAAPLLLHGDIWG